MTKICCLSITCSLNKQGVASNLLLNDSNGEIYQKLVSLAAKIPVNEPHGDRLQTKPIISIMVRKDPQVCSLGTFTGNICYAAISELLEFGPGATTIVKFIFPTKSTYGHNPKDLRIPLF